MVLDSVLEQIRGGLIVSCQVQESEPLYGSGMMVQMALAAKEGGAVGIRANGYDDIQSIKEATHLPVIGIVKRVYDESEVYITPTFSEVEEVLQGGADIVAMDATIRYRPDGTVSSHLISKIKSLYPGIIVMADVSTYEEGVEAQRAGADLVATTLSGYTEYSAHQIGPDYELIKRLAHGLCIPVIAEGRVQTPEQAKKCMDMGSFAVVVGAAITKPQEITRVFVQRIQESQSLISGE